MAKILIILWIIIHCDKKTFKGMRWDDREEGRFWLYWRHQSSRNCRENSGESCYDYCRAWARHKNNTKRKQPRDLKAAFRNALEKKPELERLTDLDTKDRIFWRIRNIDSFQYDPTQLFEELQKSEKSNANQGRKETCPLQKNSIQYNHEFPVASTSSSCEEFSPSPYIHPMSYVQKRIKSTSTRGRKRASPSQKYSIQNNNGLVVHSEASTSSAREELPYERKRIPKTTTTKTRGQPGRKPQPRRKKSQVEETITNPSQTSYYQSAGNEIPVEYEGSNNRSPLPPFMSLGFGLNNNGENTLWNESFGNNIPNAALHTQQFHNSSFQEKREEDLWNPQYVPTADSYTPPQHSSDTWEMQIEIMDFQTPTPQTIATSYPFQPTPPQQNTDILFDSYNTDFMAINRTGEEHSTPIKYSYLFPPDEATNEQMHLNNSSVSPMASGYSVSEPASLSKCSDFPLLQTKYNNIPRNTYPLDHRQFSSPVSYQAYPSNHQPFPCAPPVENISSNYLFVDSPPTEPFSDEDLTGASHQHHHNVLHYNQSVSHEMVNYVSEVIDNLSNNEIENILESVNRMLDNNGCL